MTRNRRQNTRASFDNLFYFTGSDYARDVCVCVCVYVRKIRDNRPTTISQLDIQDIIYMGAYEKFGLHDRCSVRVCAD